MSNHPIFLGADTLTSQTLFIFSLFADNVKMISPWKFQTSNPYDPKVIEIWKIWPNWVFRGKTSHFECTFSVITIVLVILSSQNLVWVSFLGVRNPRITRRRLLKPPLRYLRLQVLGTCDGTCAEKYMWPDSWKKTYHWAKNGFWFSSR